MDISIDTNKDFDRWVDHLRFKYGEDFEYLNGFHKTQLNFSDFVNGFIDKNVADVSIDPSGNASNKDARSLMSEMSKAHLKLFAFNKFFTEFQKKYNLQTAREWLETEWNGGMYLHDAFTSSFLPYCFTGNTKILTKEGIRRLDCLVDKDIKVLNINGGWEDATVKHFGKAPIRKLILERYGVYKDIYVTGNHKWFIIDPNKKVKELRVYSTDELEPGMVIPFNKFKGHNNLKPSPFGIAHGFFIGDGDKGNHLRANFCGDKVALLPYFTPANVSGNEKEYTTTGIPKYFRKLPSLDETASYLYGFLIGYFAADGCIDEHGRCTMSSVDRTQLEYVRHIMCILGLPVNEIRHQDRVSNLTNEMGRVYVLTISSEYLKEDFFIRPFHKQRYLETKDMSRRNRGWKVINCVDTGKVDDVYCAVVEGTQSFTLDGNILTHNCYAYDLTRLAKEGLFFLKNYNNEAPKHLLTFMDDLIEYISFMSNRSAGAVGIPNILIWTFYFWKKDVEQGYYLLSPDYYIRQVFQKFIYRLNQPFMRRSCAYAK